HQDWTQSSRHRGGLGSGRHAHFARSSLGTVTDTVGPGLPSQSGLLLQALPWRMSCIRSGWTQLLTSLTSTRWSHSPLPPEAAHLGHPVPWQMVQLQVGPHLHPVWTSTPAAHSCPRRRLPSGRRLRSTLQATSHLSQGTPHFHFYFHLQRFRSNTSCGSEDFFGPKGPRRSGKLMSAGRLLNG